MISSRSATADNGSQLARCLCSLLSLGIYATGGLWVQRMAGQWPDRQTRSLFTAAAAAAVLVTDSLTDADICPLARPPLPESSCCLRLPWQGLVTGGMCPGRGQMLSTSADDGRPYRACAMPSVSTDTHGLQP